MTALGSAIPIIASLFGAGATIASSIRSSKASKQISESQRQATQAAERNRPKPATARLIPEPDEERKPRGPLVKGTGLLGDTTNPELQRNRLLGN